LFRLSVTRHAMLLEKLLTFCDGLLRHCDWILYLCVFQVPVLVRFMRVFLLFRSSTTPQSVFLFYGVPYLFYRISIFIEFEGPQGLPDTDISPCRVVVHIAA
jgi:hypothetical protein